MGVIGHHKESYSLPMEQKLACGTPRRDACCASSPQVELGSALVGLPMGSSSSSVVAFLSFGPPIHYVWSGHFPVLLILPWRGRLTGKSWLLPSCMILRSACGRWERE